MNKFWISLFSLAIVSACTVESGPQSPAATKQAPNILLMIADDMGVETLSCYGVGRQFAQTPNLDRLCAKGVKFTQFWSQPSCTPTRTALMTGRHGFRTGSFTPTGPIPKRLQLEGKPNQLTDDQLMMADVRSGAYVPPEDAPFVVVQKTGKRPKGLSLGKGMPADELTLPNAIRKFDGADYAIGAIGKWHLINPRPGWESHPGEAGFDHFAGNMKGAIENYYKYDRVENGENVGFSEKYITTEQVDDALDWIQKQPEEKPWFLWLAFNAPHDGYHKPPNELISAESQKLDPLGLTTANADDYYRAMIEALDHEIGRLLSNIDEDELSNTLVIFMGDNGTSQSIIGAPYDREQGKGSVYQGGINVPLLIDGPGVNGARNISSPINVVDIFATILELSNADVAKAKAGRSIDGVSFSQLLKGNISPTPRNFNYADIKGWLPTGYSDLRAVSDGRYKLIVDYKRKTEELYDLQIDPFEKSNLLKNSSSEKIGKIRNRLVKQIDNLTNS